jgi:DNA invertase Pin-like site-specific DNA recombinase
MAEIYALIRVSTEDQNEDRQLIRMLELGILKKNIVIEKESGKSTERKKYHNLVKRFKAGDIFYIENIDRLGRDYDTILEQWYFLRHKSIFVKVLDTPLLDTDRIFKDLTEKYMQDSLLLVQAYQADSVWQRIKSSQAQGINVMPIINGKRVSSKTGNPTGRPKTKITKKQIRVMNQYHNRDITFNTALSSLNLKKTAFYKLYNRIINI